MEFWEILILLFPFGYGGNIFVRTCVRTPIRTCARIILRAYYLLTRSRMESSIPARSRAPSSQIFIAYLWQDIYFDLLFLRSRISRCSRYSFPDSRIFDSRIRLLRNLLFFYFVMWNPSHHPKSGNLRFPYFSISGSWNSDLLFDQIFTFVEFGYSISSRSLLFDVLREFHVLVFMEARLILSLRSRITRTKISFRYAQDSASLLSR